MSKCIAKRGMRRCPLDAGHDGEHEFDARSDYGMEMAKIAESVSESDEPELIQCAYDGCTHTFYFVEGRQFPHLCFDHAEMFANIAKIGSRL